MISLLAVVEHIWQPKVEDPIRKQSIANLISSNQKINPSTKLKNPLDLKTLFQNSELIATFLVNGASCVEGQMSSRDHLVYRSPAALTLWPAISIAEYFFRGLWGFGCNKKEQVVGLCSRSIILGHLVGVQGMSFFQDKFENTESLWNREWYLFPLDDTGIPLDDTGIPFRPCPQMLSPWESTDRSSVSFLDYGIFTF